MDRNELKILNEKNQQLADYRKQLAEKDRDIKQLHADVESWKGSHSVVSADRDIAKSEIQRLKTRITELETFLEHFELYARGDEDGESGAVEFAQLHEEVKMLLAKRRRKSGTASSKHTAGVHDAI